ncbi:MAG TPA: cytochrome C oxidase subunit IV family protein [Acidimicrobiia bacterium]|nr:cytochrome C oxidase subunit IV family protein [Acidimicrobiia bacterium]
MSDQVTVDPQATGLVPLGGGAAIATEGGGVVATQPHGKPHPTPQQYVLVAVILVVVTGFEIATSYLEGDVNSNLIIAALGIMAALKFFLVVAWFMHLRTDSKVLRRFFLIGLGAAPVLYLVVLLMLHFARY